MTYPNHGGDSFGNRGSHHPYGGRPSGGQQFGGQPYGAGGPYGACQPYGATGPAPGDHSVSAILVTVVSVFLCNPLSLALGIVALVRSNSVNSLWAQGRVLEASEASRQTKRISIWGAVMIVVGWFLGGIAYLLLFATLTSLPAF